MPPESNDPGLLFEMLKAAEAVVRFVSSRTRKDYDSDELLRSAVERKLEIIGEAFSGLSKELSEAHPEIAWQKISSTRNILAHDYDRIDSDVMWRIATIHAPELSAQLRKMIPPLPPDPEPETDPVPPAK
jgi:uncharacterized protein with HEPN domain